MLPLKKALSSTLGQKFFMSVTGLLLFGFLITHLAANLTLLMDDPTPFNGYTAKLSSYGSLLYVAEAGLAVLAIIHVITAIRLKLLAKSARPHAYHSAQSKGGKSKSGLSSKNMLITGVLILIFLVVHIRAFKFGPSIAEGYVANLDGQQARDLYRLVRETFHDPIYVGFYVLMMGVLGMHLRHGVWSAFQSLGATNPRTSGPIYAIGTILGWGMALGFMAIPVIIYLSNGVAK